MSVKIWGVVLPAPSHRYSAVSHARTERASFGITTVPSPQSAFRRRRSNGDLIVLRPRHRRVILAAPPGYDEGHADGHEGHAGHHGAAHLRGGALYRRQHLVAHTLRHNTGVLRDHGVLRGLGAGAVVVVERGATVVRAVAFREADLVGLFVEDHQLALERNVADDRDGRGRDAPVVAVRVPEEVLVRREVEVVVGEPEGDVREVLELRLLDAARPLEEGRLQRGDRRLDLGLDGRGDLRREVDEGGAAVHQDTANLVQVRAVGRDGGAVDSDRLDLDQEVAVDLVVGLLGVHEGQALGVSRRHLRGVDAADRHRGEVAAEEDGEHVVLDHAVLVERVEERGRGQRRAGLELLGAHGRGAARVRRGGRGAGLGLGRRVLRLGVAGRRHRLRRARLGLSLVVLRLVVAGRRRGLRGRAVATLLGLLVLRLHVTAAARSLAAAAGAAAAGAAAAARAAAARGRGGASRVRLGEARVGKAENSVEAAAEEAILRGDARQVDLVDELDTAIDEANLDLVGHHTVPRSAAVGHVDAQLTAVIVLAVPAELKTGAAALAVGAPLHRHRKVARAGVDDDRILDHAARGTVLEVHVHDVVKGERVRVVRLALGLRRRVGRVELLE
mmetsp:Transcript_32797/g.75872  ORF Transcript_32797/g.75872 Transcript_32797/m.75872 type:complete len:617 (-) Transcript_32797:229-2079(-)